MKICPVCNDSFADQLNFCDVDGVRLARDGSVQERNKWWSLLGVGLLVGALVISAASIVFLPKARVSPVVNSEPPASPAPPKPQAESVAAVSSTAGTTEPASVPTDVAVPPELKKKDKALANANVHGEAPNPKAAALAAEEADKKLPSTDVNSAPPVPKKPEAPPSMRSVNDQHSADTAAKPQPPPDLKKDQKAQPAIARSSNKDSNDKKKDDDKDKKKGGFLRVFKKIFGKD